MAPYIKVEKPPDEPSVQDLIAKMRPDLREAVERLRATLQNSPLQKEVEEFKSRVLKKGPNHEQTIFSFIPHQMAKTSIFFPLSDSQLKEENRKINRVEHKTGWGRIVIEGIKLAIFEEDIFLALLHLAKDKTERDKDNRPILKTRLPEVAKLLYGDKGYTNSVYNRIIRTLEHFELVRFELAVGEWRKRGKERIKTETVTSMAGILSKHIYNEETQELTIYWNQDFLAYFLESMLSNINLTLRRQLKKDGSKALLRFLCAHTDPGRMHMLTVLNAINYNIDQPPYRLRSRLRSCIRELKKHGVLGNKTKFFKDDTVYFDILPPQKALPD